MLRFEFWSFVCSDSSFKSRFNHSTISDWSETFYQEIYKRFHLIRFCQCHSFQFIKSLIRERWIVYNLLNWVNDVIIFFARHAKALNETTLTLKKVIAFRIANKEKKIEKKMSSNINFLIRRQHCVLKKRNIKVFKLKAINWKILAFVIDIWLCCMHRRWAQILYNKKRNSFLVVNVKSTHRRFVSFFFVSSKIVILLRFFLNSSLYYRLVRHSFI